MCTHLILRLPAETPAHYRESLRKVLELGVGGLKLHPLHVVKGTALANEWRRGEYDPLSFEEYVKAAADLIARTPGEVVFHRVTGTASKDILLAPEWCSQKWRVLNAITEAVARRGGQAANANVSSSAGRAKSTPGSLFSKEGKVPVPFAKRGLRRDLPCVTERIKAGVS